MGKQARNERRRIRGLRRSAGGALGVADRAERGLNILSSTSKPNFVSSSASDRPTRARPSIRRSSPSNTPRRNSATPATGSSTSRNVLSVSDHSHSCAATAAGTKRRSSTPSTASPARSTAPNRRSSAVGTNLKNSAPSGAAASRGTPNMAGPTSVSAPSTSNCTPSRSLLETSRPIGRRTCPSAHLIPHTNGWIESPRSLALHSPARI
jgi:hypothetical protein